MNGSGFIEGGGATNHRYVNICRLLVMSSWFSVLSLTFGAFPIISSSHREWILQTNLPGTAVFW